MMGDDTMTQIVIIGGSDAGVSAALRAREVNATCQITVVAADAYPNYSSCGLPYYLSGEVADSRTLAHRTRVEIAAHGITLLLEAEATRLDLAARVVHLRSRTDSAHQVTYDRLLLATGASPRRPAIAGLDQEGVFLLHSMESSFAFQRFLTTQRPRRVAIVGGGYIGLEMAEALTHRGLRVTLLQRGTSVLSTVDPAIGARVRATLERHRVTVVAGIPVAIIERRGKRFHVHSGDRTIADVDAVLVATGVEPNTALGHAAGLALSARGASPSMSGWRLRVQGYTPPATVSSRIIASFRSQRTCRWARRRTSRGVWPGRTPPGAIDGSLDRSGHR
jgi:NADPH-dependent 2,4-dienoyl-CoA reductase/sulfur reductase-like enzyme